MVGSQTSLRLAACVVVLLVAVSYSTVDGMFFTSLASISQDIIKSPLESLSLFALKSYLFGHLGGRMAQYRQMMYNANRPYGAANNNNGQYYGNVHNRGRRDVNAPALDVVNDEDSQQFLEMAEKFDIDKCIPRMVCEVMAGSSMTEGGQFEELVVKVFGDEVPEQSGDQKLFSSIYHYAAFAGKRAEQPDRCQPLFPKCKASENEFKKLANKIFTGVDADNVTTQTAQ